MIEKYPIYHIDPEWIIKSDSVGGTIAKNWYLHPELGRCLFKQAKSKVFETNVDWTEKVVYELGKLMNLPVARYELATGFLDGNNSQIDGIVSPSYLQPNHEEISGRELVERLNIANSPYTIERTLTALDAVNAIPPSSWNRIDGIDTAAKLYVGYAALDTLIANTDRHERNWGVTSLDNRTELIPSYDHGYSLGIHLDERTKSTLSPARFAVETPSDYRESDSGLLLEASDRVLCRDVFENAAKSHPASAKIWQQQLANISPTAIKAIFDRLPSDRVSPISAQFAQDLIIHNRQQILSLSPAIRHKSVRKLIAEQTQQQSKRQSPRRSPRSGDRGGR
jgi:hypothetical protein